MRYILFTLVFSLSFLTNAQHVLTTFDKTVASENFSEAQIIFPQKYNVNELFMLENGTYLLKRINPIDYSISYAKIDDMLSSFRMNASIELTKSKTGTAGLVVHGQKLTNGAIILEINAKRQFRIRKIFNDQEKYLTGSDNEGWIKSKSIHKKGKNTLELRTDQGYYDVYINGNFIYTVFDLQFENGSCGLFINGGSEMRVYSVNVFTKGSNLISENDGKDSSNTEMDASFQEVILLFKTKIDQQQQEIEQLQFQLDKCKSMLNYDTSLVTRSQELEIDNERLLHLLDSTTTALNKANKRLEYLESFRQDVEAGSNGDLVLNLTTILADIKKENKTLKDQLSSLKSKNTELENGNAVLLREIERLKKLLETQNE